MKVGVNCFLLKKNIGGLRQYFLRLFDELLASDSDNRYVFFYFEHNRQELDELRNERWRDDAILLGNQREIGRHLDDVDVYFCPFGALWPQPVPIPSVITLVDVQEKYFPQFFSKQALWDRQYYYTSSTKMADAVITISQFSRDSIAEHYNISPEKIHVAYLAGNALYYEDRDEGSKPDSLLPDRYVFYPANRWFHKNHDNLLKALLIIKKESGMEVPCLFTGFDYDKGYQLNEKIKEYGLSGQARSIGYVTLEEMKYLYKHAEMLCFPSLFEGFGMPPVEAMASGCPVICSNTTSLPEVVEEAALLFDPTDPRDIADKIVKLWNDEQLRQEFIGLGKVQARKFSVKKMADDHMRAFNQAVSSFSRKKYFYNKYIYEPLHVLRMKPRKVIT